MNTKLVGFIQGAFYPIVMTLLAYVISNLGSSDLVSAGTATIITGFLSLVENWMQEKGKGALFGFAEKQTIYSAH